ncbi:SLBB domain-containing protein [candidate division KSB1 bacterium]|nr:SLBB domain-containing protein [candidate division KSB1 bacterium]
MKHRFIFLLVVFILISSSCLDAQTGSESGTRRNEESLNISFEQQMLQALPPALETPIDEHEYHVGPGDVLSVNTWGSVNTGFVLKITPEGKLLIPLVKDIDLTDLTLQEAKQRIKQEVERKYRNTDVTVTLADLRRFRVHVAGQVSKPGAVVVTGINRVSDAIRMANPPVETEETEPELKTYSGKAAALPVVVMKVPSKRHIVLTRRDGEKIPIDLHSYEIYGNNEHNPYMLEGDVIYVPLFTKNLPICGVYGAVHEPEKYEFMEGDRVMDLIKLAHGFTYNADPSNIEVARFNSDNKTTYSFKVDLTKTDPETGELLENIPLVVDDRIYVRYQPEYRIRRQVEIKGEIIYPGDYPIELNSVRLSEIVKAAGGFTENASLKEAFVIRTEYENIPDPEYDRLFEMSVEEMTELEREYFKIKSRERKGIVAVDFEKLFIRNDENEDIILQDKDYIEIPMKDDVVAISGQVKRPGLQPYLKNKTLDYYIGKAGGYGWNAHTKRVRIIRAETGEWIKPKSSTVVQIGDEIIVPEKAERDGWAIFKDILSTTVQVVTLALVIQNMNN